ncbi:hypothetical protein [Algoriphagus machipongonensis]|uniref:Uncharacterized protein n=1 Tax=Algoriphagus machipongonensis TaxID=388413 RepID=A3I2X7_9BACT|nr:hypothetical protein [Algoriphagus machipongonensis]EAZ79176.1 hypothetical protein ALPR1_13934 [Algoriphagus machipongonensis]
MKNKILLVLTVLWGVSISQLSAQTAGEYFNQAARSYVKTDKELALNTLNEGLGKYPGDSKLQALKEKLEKEQEEEQEKQQQNQDPQENQDQQQKDQNEQGEGEQSEEQQQQKDQGEKTEEDKAKEGQEGDPSDQTQDDVGENANDQKDANLADRQKALEEFKEKLKAMNLTPQQAAQILESMNAAELRYIQQNKKKPTQRPKRGIPDW